MCALKFPLPISLPRPGSAGFLPACLSGVLLLGLLAQFVLPGTTVLPAGSALLPRNIRVAAIPAIGDYPIIRGRPLFTPSRQFDEVVASAKATESNTGNFSIAGIATGRGLATAFIKNHDGTATAVHVGMVHEGWTVAAIHRDSVTFTRADARIDVPVGPHSELTTQNGTQQANAFAIQGQRETHNPEADEQETPPQETTQEEAKQ